jgi:hypothetical protein
MAQDKRKSRTMSDSHKAALAQGREQGRAVRRYLEAVEATRPKRGRKRSPDGMRKRLKAIEDQLPDADPLKAVQLRQERMNLTRELDAGQTKVDLTALEKAFVAAAKPYSDRKGLTYAAWRESGVDPAVLRKAGITRSHS